MKGLWNGVQSIFILIGEWLSWFLGGYDDLFIALIIFIVVNCITDVMCDIEDKKVSGKVVFWRIVKKGLIFLLVGIAHILDIHIMNDTGSALRTMIILFYISNEGMGFLKNIRHLGLPIPKKIEEILEQLYGP